MTDFLFLYRTNESSQREAMGTPERAQQSMQRWLDWMRDLETRGHLKDGGHPLEATGKVVRGPKKAITDGPFAEAKDLVAGFTIIRARDAAEAAELAKGCPILAGDGAVEVRPLMTMSV
ncbi:MAG: YciI family protein [Vicinamibacterales bacterium]